MIREKWLYILLSWLWINRESFEDTLDEVESIYTDFDYPAEIESFIKYIPLRMDMIHQYTLIRKILTI